jgi:hypothetical protein
MDDTQLFLALCELDKRTAERYQNALNEFGPDHVISRAIIRVVEAVATVMIAYCEPEGMKMIVVAEEIIQRQAMAEELRRNVANAN